MRKWILVDADPKRATGTSSTDDEKKKAKFMTGKIYNFLRDIGFAYPIVTDSGNGYHLLYNVEIENTPGAKELVKTFLQALDVLFSDDHVNIDTTVFNASRITKLYGTMVRKGTNTPERPHRLSGLIKIPEIIEKTSWTLIKKVADMLPKPEVNQQKYNYQGISSTFDINDFMSRYLNVSKIVQSSIGTKYILESCPFDSNHKAPDSMIAVMNNGAIAFKCLHNSCSDKTWHDVRELYEPRATKAYDISRTTKPIQSPPPKNTPPESPTEKPKRYVQLHEIEDIDRSQIVSLPTGIKILDKKIIGLNKKEVTVISGNNGSGKSTIIGQFILEHIECGFKSTLFSGELEGDKVKNWLRLQAAGRQFNKKSQYGENAYYTPKIIGKQIDEWAKGNLFIHLNSTGKKFSDVLDTIEQTVEIEKSDIIYIDNLMAIDISEITGDKNERQTNVILRITDIAKRYNVHIVIICHPRKPNGLLRKEDISGTADLTNAVDNVFMCHRINRDFEINSKTFFDKIFVENFLANQYTNCIEVMKNRDLGIQDELIGMYFEPESKRLLNERHENKNYSWKKPYSEFEQSDAEFDSPPF